jgi:lysophospholipase L1-like esterase
MRTTAAVLLLVLCGFERAMNEPGTNAATSRFLALGDSYTIGEAVPEADRWPNQLARMLPDRGGPKFDRVQIIATTGWTTDELSAAIDRESPRGPYQLVSLLIGVNNQYRGRSVEQFAPEFAALLKRAIGFAGGDAGRVRVVSIPDWGVMPFAKDRDRAQIAREIDAYNAACRTAAAAAGVRFIDVTGISRRATTQPSLIAADGLHPSGEQYRLWAEAVAKSLSDND